VQLLTAVSTYTGGKSTNSFKKSSRVTKSLGATSLININSNRGSFPMNCGSMSRVSPREVIPMALGEVQGLAPLPLGIDPLKEGPVGIDAQGRPHPLQELEPFGVGDPHAQIDAPIERLKGLGIQAFPTLRAMPSFRTIAQTAPLIACRSLCKRCIRRVLTNRGVMPTVSRSRTCTRNSLCPSPEWACNNNPLSRRMT